MMNKFSGEKRTSCGTDLDVQSVDAELLASRSNILSSQHGSIWGRLVTIGLDFHATCNSANGFAAAEISDMNKGIVEGCEDACHAEDEFTCCRMQLAFCST